ncbi:MAG: hypothetical protein H7Y14_11480 [Burkholderiales bacterium]|nr:hypothetical protein [Burkholderiales bacterium]
MNLVKSRTCIAVAVLLAAGLAACDKNAGVRERTAAAPDPSAQVIGKLPAEPSGDPPGTTAVATPTEVSKPVEQNSMPLPGQANDHSNSAALPSQKAETVEVLKEPELAKKANSGPPLDERKTQ